MRKLFYLGFTLFVAMGVGCVLTNYELIVDNDQVKSGGQFIVNTNGKAHIRESSQIATLWADGADELLWFVDQKANGDRKLYTYNNFSTAYPIFHDDMYCNPDWQGCMVGTADDPEVGDVDIYDYNINWNCSGARSLTYLTSTTRYYGECGRAKMGLQDRIALLNMGRYGKSLGMEGLWFDLNHNNTTITLDNNAGYSTSLPITGDAGFFMGAPHKAYLDLTNPMMAGMFRSYADFLTRATHSTTMTLTYNGISTQMHMAGNYGLSNPSRVLSNVNTRS